MENIRDDIHKFSRGDINAYLIGKDILIDGVGAQYFDEYLVEVESFAGIGNIKYAVVNHCEPNRCASLIKLLDINPNITVIASTAGLKFLSRLIEKPFKQILAKDGMCLDLCGRTLKFILAPYLNWPDSMLTLYGGALFSCDLFSGNDCAEYFADNLMTRSDYARLALGKLKSEKFDLILPAEGGAKTSGVIKDYEELLHKNSDRAVMVYHSMYGYTYEMSKIVKEIFSGELEIYNAAEDGAENIASAVNGCSALIIGTDTINADAPESIWNVVAKTDKIINKQKPCMLFGSYGWGGEGLYFLETHLKMLKYKMFKKPFGAEFKLNDDEKREFIKYIKEFESIVKQTSKL
ncbi:MAG: hypothetical protein LUD03_02340 [Firmicutes bacterium]|nr:hypothetical protein [Bacillota bacterium]